MKAASSVQSRLRRLHLYPKIVLDREYREHALRAAACEGFIGVGRNDSFQPNLAILDDDVDRGYRLWRVPTKTGLSVNRPIDGQPDAIIVRRQRQYFDLIVDALDALYLFYNHASVGLQRGSGHLPHERDLVAVDSKAEVV